MMLSTKPRLMASVMLTFSSLSESKMAPTGLRSPLVAMGDARWTDMLVMRLGELGESGACSPEMEPLLGLLALLLIMTEDLDMV